jgi:hypothetical protein
MNFHGDLADSWSAPGNQLKIGDSSSQV